MSAFHKPAYNFIKTALIGNIKLLGIMWTLIRRIACIAAHRGSGATGNLRYAKAQKL